MGNLPHVSGSKTKIVGFGLKLLIPNSSLLIASRSNASSGKKARLISGTKGAEISNPNSGSPGSAENQYRIASPRPSGRPISAGPHPLPDRAKSFGDLNYSTPPRPSRPR